MKTKIVYVVVSSDNDCYIEQTLLSVYSLRLYNPDAEVLLLVDKDTDNIIAKGRNAILKYITQKIIVNVPNGYTQKQKSRFIKTTLRKYISGDYLFVDSDTIITANLSEIDDIPFEIAAVPDLHIEMKHIDWIQKYLKKWSKLLNWNYCNNKYYFNSGVFYVKDTPETHNLYKMWHTAWNLSSSKGLDVDQPALAKADGMHNYIIKKLDDKWNCQITAGGLAYLIEAKIIHYFSSVIEIKTHPYFFLDKKVYEEIKMSGVINENLHNMILNAKLAFNPPCQIIGSTEIPLLSTYTYKMYLYHRPFFHFIESICHLIYIIGHNIKHNNLVKN